MEADAEVIGENSCGRYGEIFSKKVEKDEKKEKHSLISDKKEF